MDYGKMTLVEIAQGYHLEPNDNAYVCNHCGETFPMDSSFSAEEQPYAAEHEAKMHMQIEHSGSFAMLLHSNTKYNTLTEVQKELFWLFFEGKKDGEIAQQLGISASTVRHQRFTFRERAKQAKFYLAVYEQALGKAAPADQALAPLHNTATMVDDRYVTTEKEKAKILEAFLESNQPLKLKEFSPKAKKKVIILARIAEEFTFGKIYTEKEIKTILKSIYPDHATLRRSLVDYGFLGRTKDGKEYWLK